MQYDMNNIAKIIKAENLRIKNNSKITQLLLDSRKLGLAEEGLFFAIKGPTHDGHHYIQQCYEKGVRNFVVQEKPDLRAFPKANFLLVDDSVTALQKLVAHHRSQFQYPVIGITGSNGKTIIKEWLFQLLWQDYDIVRSPKSYNSQVGVPLSVWEMDAHHQMGIFEAGISQLGEMEHLAPIIQADIGILSNIQSAHDEGFDNRTQKLVEKLKLFDSTKWLFYCADHLLIRSYLHQHPIKANTLSWGKHTSADLKIKRLRKKADGTHLLLQYGEKIFPLLLPFSDEASIENALHCCLLLLHLKYDTSIINERMQKLNPVGMRLELKQGINACSIINDTYNSDLHSLEIALDFLQLQKSPLQKTLLLSDILQSGQSPQELYQKVAQLIQQKKVDRLIGVGPAIYKYLKPLLKLKEMQYFKSRKKLEQAWHQLSFHEECILIKGARSYQFEQFSQLLSLKLHSTALEINLNAIAHNFKVYKSKLKPDTKLMVMVKSSAYGSGSHEVANLLSYHQADYLAVAYTDEGADLRQAGIQLPIMVMNTELAGFESLYQNRLEPEIFSFRQLQNFIQFLSNKKLKQPYPIHIMIDTGMHRLGFESNDIKALNALLKEHKKLIRVAAILSHLAASDDLAHEAFTRSQISTFKRLAKRIEKHLSYRPIRHILNSAGIINYPEAQMDMVRLGIGLYGIDAANQIQDELENVSTLKSYIAQIKRVKAEESVGYSRKGQVKGTAKKIATVNIGYGDGLSRSLSNGVGHLLVNGHLAPIIGNVCMDMCMLDISGIPVREGDEVIVFGQDLPVSLVAEWANTIPYEILTSISQRVKRVFYQE